MVLCVSDMVRKRAIKKVLDEIEDDADDDAPLKFQRFTTDLLGKLRQNLTDCVTDNLFSERCSRS